MLRKLLIGHSEYYKTGEESERENQAKEEEGVEMSPRRIGLHQKRSPYKEARDLLKGGKSKILSNKDYSKASIREPLKFPKAIITAAEGE
ncbi:hypothetical protein C922_05505 [Plasmodium inui San Antonio 1]|uniref:Uncharacterized protein n=1 Tax=Plasmodium inui San Antonio 1 TaxID=1237626 RepID=W7A4U1_9APIC|nr:hypothetical protein C922_05505 [Plasmodium inui San Antonio 1]EUD64114.1 hypothetical protein C922_05505 [Plasmodium inui San Antonio 1]